VKLINASGPQVRDSPQMVISALSLMLLLTLLPLLNVPLELPKEKMPAMAQLPPVQPLLLVPPIVNGTVSHQLLVHHPQ